MITVVLLFASQC